MKAVILAGGRGTRITEETNLKPKPMIEIGGLPILWHIMKIFSSYGVNDFIICCGYKGYVIKEYFSNYFLHTSDVTFDLAKNRVEIHQSKSEPWRVTLVDTGEQTMTGGRLLRVRPFIGEEDFLFTYGDGVGDIDIRKLTAFHKTQGTLATLSAMTLPSRFGSLAVAEGKATLFREKSPDQSSLISGGFFVLSPRVIDYIEGDHTTWEREPMERLAKEGQLSAFVHKGFWHPMDTLRDKEVLEALWNSGKAPWKIWK
ncbi:MAG TPA: glucose-1-phosphate cytidylyltransferase [Bdellovibrionota bacterium]|nr:glucose-1-phosphate cytidylyltransferase [Bdellovibrionota bacterium]